ncbi:glycosyl hydrolase family 3 N-terminal domain protein [Limosilactobacillus fermentum 28-3-CHN]|uniref:Glycosyl hydrolase family 3 N-terminal domain protein n=2 Tax=Limosilactobacillus fermentum TaxID=1613 RepID=D0DRJ3_LIMFE|nr:glycosyl hydrolase family 3 N-terminal domain protein [Limosilactobacillus fermentum 28-3-CHN]
MKGWYLMSKIDIAFVEKLTLEERASLVSGHDFWFTADISGFGRMMMTDGPSGLRKQVEGADALGLNDSVKAVCFPCSALTASTYDDDLLLELGKQIGTAAKSENVGVLLGPGVNIKRSPLAGRNFEYFSEDPLVAGRMGTAYVNGVQSKNVGVSVKHFAANNRENQRFTSSSNIDERTLREIYLAQFERIVKKAKPATLMCSYNKINGVQVSNNQRLLTHILRDEWGFDGLVMSDWGAVVDHIKAIKAGLDLEMPGKGQKSIDEIVTAVKNGTLDEAVLNRAALRVLKLVEKYHSNDNTQRSYDKEAQHKFARKLAGEGMVLLKNDQKQLPLNDEESIAVIGELATNPRYEGSGSSHVNAYRLVTPVEVIPKNATFAQGYRLDGRESQPLLNESIELAKRSDKVVIFIGFPEQMESEGFDKNTIDLPENQNLLINEILKVNNNVTIVLQNGSVVAMPWANDVPAILETYLAGEAVGEATWDVLLGKLNPSGKLAETFPISLKDTPTYKTFGVDSKNENYREGLLVGYRYYDTKEVPVQFPFGHGLSYTTFGYSSLEVKENSDNVDVEFTVTNTGHIAGKEIVQVYVANKVSRIEKPDRELRGFKKISLNPGESKKVKITLDRRSFSWYNVEGSSWEMDNGQYEIQVGSSIIDIKLRKEVCLTIGSDKLSKVTGETYVGELMENASAEQIEIIKEFGLYQKLKELLESEQRAILANVPLQSLEMVGIDGTQIKKMLEKLNN